MALLSAALVFLTVVILCALPFLLSPRQAGQEIKRRLESLEEAQQEFAAPSGRTLMRDEMLSAMPLFHRLLLRWSAAARLRRFLEQAGMQIKPGKLVLVMGVLASATYFILSGLVASTPICLGTALAAGAIPLAVVSGKRRRRLRVFEKQFVEAIDLLSRAVRAGHALSSGMQMIGQELTDPVAGEFRTASEEQNLGLPMRDALIHLVQRVPLPDVQFFVTALLIQKETGGNLAEILDGLAATIRERFKILGEVRTRTAQGRLTAAILIALPPFVMVMLSFLNPAYLQLLFTDSLGTLMLTAAVALQVAGSVFLWRIVHIEV